MERFGCPPQCYPAILATNYRTMGWRWALTLTAPPGQLEAAWATWWKMAGQWDQISSFAGREASEIPETLPFTIYGVPAMSYRFIPKIRWASMDRARAELDRLRPDAWPFWTATFAIGQNGTPHIHMAVGGEIGYQEATNDGGVETVSPSERWNARVSYLKRLDPLAVPGGGAKDLRERIGS
jgi:hypothetical protein